MAVNRAYLDYNASAPLLPAARDAMLAALDIAANPSSVHGEGRLARLQVEEARRDVAALLGAAPDHVVFTSGATEAAYSVLTPDWRMGRGPLCASRLYVCASDHSCMLSGGRFAPDKVTVIGVDSEGLVRLDELGTALSDHDSAEGFALVAFHLANNETGVVQPMQAIAGLVKAAGGVLVWDAVQAAGRLPLDLSTGCGDFLIVSAHKIGGPKGAGAYVAASDLMMPLPLVGGGQERGHRGGTENVACIAGFGAAAREAARSLAKMDRIRAMRGLVEQAVLAVAPDAEIFGSRTERLANTVFFAIPGIKAETAQIGLDLAGFAVSAGSACSSGKVGPSHVLKAMGYSRPEGALRVSIGAATTEEEIGRLRGALGAIVARREGRTKAA